MPFPAAARVEELRERFEGREAIYVEKGAVRVRVSDIRWDIAKLCIAARVKEIPTAGFPAGVFYDVRIYEPRSWSIEGGYLTTSSEHTWDMGYGGWSLFFAPGVVDGVVQLALQFPEDLDPFQRYREVLKYLENHNVYEPTQRVFAER